MLDLSRKSILYVALPLMLSGFIQSVISITDASFLSRYSTLAYEASGASGLWYITLYMVFLGLSDGAQISLAQSIGRKDSFGFGQIFRANFVLLAIAALTLFILVQTVVPQLLDHVVTNKALADAQNEFLGIRGYAFFAAIVSLTIQSCYMALGKTKIVMFASLIVAISNIVLDYFMVFGNGGFPKMGLAGAAWASTIAEILGALFLLIHLFTWKARTEWELFSKRKIRWAVVRSNLQIGAPLIFQGVIALSIWTVFFMWIEQMGGDHLAISLNIRYIYFLAFIPIWGFAGAAKTYVAQYYGAKQFDAIQIIQRRIQFLTVLFLVITFHGAILYPEYLIRLVSNNPEQVIASANILRLVFGSIIIYALGSVYFQTVSAIGKTRITLLIEMCATFLYILSAYLFIKVWHWDLLYVWIVEYIYFITMGSIAFFYIRWNRTHLTKTN
jgi:putative MATE family efflux protein